MEILPLHFNIITHLMPIHVYFHYNFSVNFHFYYLICDLVVLEMLVVLITYIKTIFIDQILDHHLYSKFLQLINILIF